MNGNFNLGLSLKNIENNSDEILQILGNDDFFTSCEASSEQLRENSEELKKLDISLIDPLPSSQCTAVCEESLNLKLKFINTISEICDILSEFKNPEISMDFDVETSFENSEVEDLKIDLIKKIAPAFIEKNIKLNLPVRINKDNQNISENFNLFIQKTMLPFLGTRVDIYPHEINPEIKPEELLKNIKFDINSFSFIYDAASGNHLVPKLISPWIEYFDKTSFKGKIIFKAQVFESEILKDEIKKIKKLFI